MTRPTLTIARKPKPGPSFAMLRKAVALFRSDLAPRSVRRHNARAWLRSVMGLGDKHLYRGGAAKWGHGGSL
jgi:hypothetical protein